MKSRFFALFFLTFFSAALHAESISFSIIKNPYKFATYFELLGKKGTYEGRVISDYFSVRTTYDLYDRKADFEARGICRVLSLGILFPWAREIDVYNSSGRKLGLIDGKAVTTALAKFHLYDEKERLAAIAYLDDNHSFFSIVDSTRAEKPLGHLKRHLKTENKSEWEAVLYNTEEIDPRVFKIFAAFISDYEQKF